MCIELINMEQTEFWETIPKSKVPAGRNIMGACWVLARKNALDVIEQDAKRIHSESRKRISRESRNSHLEDDITSTEGHKICTASGSWTIGQMMEEYSVKLKQR